MQKDHFICIPPQKDEFQKKSIGSGAVDVIADSSEFAFRKRYMTDRTVV